MRYFLTNLRQRLAHVDALPQLVILGLVAGLFSGVVNLAFRGLIEISQWTLLGRQEAYEDLPTWAMIAMPTVGALFIGLLWQRLGDSRQVGVVHVIANLGKRHGRLPLKNMLVQFFAGSLSIASGHSVGREGPAVHLGATSASLVGHSLGLPNNSTRVLIGAGCAAAISASFNTPIAGVIFAIEVVIMEYALASILPVILASVIGAVISRAVFGDAPAFHMPSLTMGSLLHLPWLALLGLMLGLLSASFIQLVQSLAKTTGNWPIWLRTSCAGLATGLLALIAPQVMGIGYDTIGQALIGELAITTLLIIVAAKLLATSACVAMELPGGLIGPVLFMGALTGSAMGLIGLQLVPDMGGSAGFYASVGMAAMMGAVLQAPLAALMALLELTHNPNIIMPAMLVLVIAHLTSSQLFGKRSIFLHLLEARGLRYSQDPVSQALRRAGVAAVMERKVIRHNHLIDRTQAHQLRRLHSRWLLLDDDQGPCKLVAIAMLHPWLDSRLEQDDWQQLDLLDESLPGQKTVAISLQSSLNDAWELLHEENAGALYIPRDQQQRLRIRGIITKGAIENYYNRR